MITRRKLLFGLLATPAIIASDRLMKIVRPYYLDAAQGTNGFSLTPGVYAQEIDLTEWVHVTYPGVPLGGYAKHPPFLLGRRVPPAEFLKVFGKPIANDRDV